MIQILIRVVVEGTKAAAPHVARHAHRVVPLVAPHVANGARHVTSQLPTLAKAGSAAGAVGAAGVGTARVTHHAAAAAASGTAAKAGHLAEDVGIDVAAGEAVRLGIKAIGKKAGGHED